MERGVGDVEIEAGGAQTGMAEQQLDATQVDPGFEQMRRKGVPERFDILLHLIDRY